MNQDNHKCVNEALEVLSELTKQEENSIDASGKRLIVSCMREHIDEADIQAHGCQILNNLIVTGKSNIRIE